MGLALAQRRSIVRNFIYLNQVNSSQYIVSDDLRPTGVVLDRDIPLRTKVDYITISTQVTTVKSMVNILEVKNFNQANVKFKIKIRTTGNPLLTGSSISWSNNSSWPNYLTLTQVGDEYTVSGISSAQDWQYVKNFNWNLPANYTSFPSFNLLLTIEWYDGELGSTTGVEWAVADQRYFYLVEMPAVASLVSNTSGKFNAKSGSAMSASLVLDQPLTLEYYQSWGGTYGDNSMLQAVGTNIVVDWGDGNKITYGTITDADYASGGKYYPKSLTHVYDNPGTYTVRVYGDVTKFKSKTQAKWNSTVGPDANRGYFTKMISWPLSNLTTISLAGAALDYLPNFIPKKVDDLTEFLSQGSATGVAHTNLAAWDTKYVYRFTRAFLMTSQVDSYNAPVENWDTRSARYLDGMFYNNKTFNRDISRKTGYIWYLGIAGQYFDDMFYGASAFNQNIGNWTLNGDNFTRPMTMQRMFMNATVFNQDLSAWNVTNIPTKPTDFDTNTPAWVKTNRQPRWGV